MQDALSQYEPKSNSRYLKVESGAAGVKLRVLTLDPLVSVDKWGNTKYSFVIWNWTENKAQVWSTTPGNLKKLTALHRNEDWPPLNKIDVTVSAEGEMKEKRYEITPLPKAQEMTADIVEQCKAVNLEELVSDNIGRLSAHLADEDGFEDGGEAGGEAGGGTTTDSTPNNAPTAPTGYMKAKAQYEKIARELDEPKNESQLPDSPDDFLV
jgi:hypothetical protein